MAADSIVNGTSEPPEEEAVRLLRGLARGPGQASPASLAVPSACNARVAEKTMPMARAGAGVEHHHGARAQCSDVVACSLHGLAEVPRADRLAKGQAYPTLMRANRAGVTGLGMSLAAYAGALATVRGEGAVPRQLDGHRVVHGGLASSSVFILPVGACWSRPLWRGASLVVSGPRSSSSLWLVCRLLVRVAPRALIWRGRVSRGVPAA